MNNKGILILSPFFSPNIGGTETHLEDLVKKLDKLGYIIYVLTYSPITTANVTWKSNEKWGKNTFIKRFNWIGHNLFHRLEKHPLINFFYITPYLFLRSFFWLLTRPRQINVIHSHGINAALIGLIFQKVFRIPRHLVSIYSSYDNVSPGPTTIKLMTFVLNHCDKVLTQSQISLKQLAEFGIPPSKLDLYRHWIDLKQFVPNKLSSKFTVLFVGRMIKPKGAHLLLKTAKFLPKINFIFVGDGPEYSQLIKNSISLHNVKFVGSVPYKELANWYQQASLFCLPSLYAEGWGRVLMEAIACGLPVIASNRGAIPEFIDRTIGIITPPTSQNFTKIINKLYCHPALYRKLQKNCRPFALKNFSTKNIQLITRYY